MDAHCGVAYCIQLVEINLCMIRVICSTFNGFFSSDVHTDIRPFAFWLQNVLIRFASSAHSTESIHFWTDAFAGFLHMPMNLWRASNPKKKTHTQVKCGGCCHFYSFAWLIILCQNEMCERLVFLVFYHHSCWLLYRNLFHMFIIIHALMCFTFSVSLTWH